MIEIECDNCEKTFAVDSDQAGMKVACPMCGDINRVPGEGAAGAAPAPAKGRDAIPRADGPEQEILVVRPAMFRAHPFRYLLIVIVFIGGIVGAIMGSATLILLVLGLAVSLAMAIWFGWWWMSTHWWLKLVITNKRSIRHEGIIQRHTTEVLHNHVRSVDINQTFLERVFRIGRIGIDSAGQEGIEIQINDIPGPYEIKQAIDRYREDVGGGE